MRDKFTKADLKDGMVVEQRNGEMFLAIGKRVVGKTGFNWIGDYTEDLSWEGYEEFRVVRIYKIISDRIYNIDDIFKKENLELIWEHIETKRMTAEEMRNKLEELTGENIEVEHSREEMICKLKLYCDGRSCAKCILSRMSSVCNYCKLEDSKLKQYYEKVMEDEKARN